MAIEDAILNQLVEGQLGASPQGAPQGAPVAPPQGAPAQQAAPAAPHAPSKADPSPTPTEQATAKGEPTAPGAEPSFDYIEIDDGDGGKRQLTMQQIQGTMSRYRDLNHKWATEHKPMEPVLGVVRQIMDASKKTGYEPKGEEVADLVQAALKAYLQNPQMGQQPGKGKEGTPPAEKKGAQPAMGEFDDEMLSAWEKENAVSLPPGFKEMAGGFKSIQGQMGQLMQLVQQAISAQPGQQQQLQQQRADVTQQQGAVATRAIKLNLSQAMQANQIPAEAEGDFMQFAMMRGYAPEDFVDPELAATVVADYKANKDAPEIARLREVAQRRQAFTGRIEGAPGSAAAPSPAGGADPMFASLVESAMKK